MLATAQIKGRLKVNHCYFYLHETVLKVEFLLKKEKYLLKSTIYVFANGTLASYPAK